MSNYFCLLLKRLFLNCNSFFKVTNFLVCEAELSAELVDLVLLGDQFVAKLETVGAYGCLN